MDINQALVKTFENKGSDLHITVNLPPIMRINGNLEPYGELPLKEGETEGLLRQIMNESQLAELNEYGDVDFPYEIPGVTRFRVNAYKQRGHYSAAFRVLNINIPTIDQLGFPDSVKELALKKRGFILVTGPTGSGKSTTLAAMVNHINQNRSCHIITLEHPIEYMHRHGRSMINQREIGDDAQTFGSALRAALREDPDVILVGEMRDPETISIAITAAETGHLVMSTLHTSGADQAIDRIIDVFTSNQQQQIRIQLASVLNGVISQQLLPTEDGMGRVAALEILMSNHAISNLIREGKTHQIQSSIQTGIKSGMRPMDYSLSELVQRGIIDRETAFSHAVDPDMLKRYLTQPASF
jgi:twitching motility protein PilT